MHNAASQSAKLLNGINTARLHALVLNAVAKFKLDLCGFKVLTEAASGYYMLTSLIAVEAGADKVYALAKDTRYGKAADIAAATENLAKVWGLRGRVEVFSSREDERISRADIVTNLGHVRPLDREFLSRLNPTAAIPLMWEAWEFRPEDMDLAYCRKVGIPVVATNEGHKLLRIMDYVGMLPIKLLLESDVEVARSQVAVLGGGKFGVAVSEALQNCGAQIIALMSEPKLLAEKETLRKLAACDALVIIEHVFKNLLIGRNGPLSFKKLGKINPGLVVAHIAGNIDPDDLRCSGLAFRPQHIAKPGFMSVATDYVGPRPLIDLHTAGLKLGREMASARRKGLSVPEAEKYALKTGFGQSMTGIKA